MDCKRLLRMYKPIEIVSIKATEHLNRKFLLIFSARLEIDADFLIRFA